MHCNIICKYTVIYINALYYVICCDVCKFTLMYVIPYVVILQTFLPVLIIDVFARDMLLYRPLSRKRHCKSLATLTGVKCSRYLRHNAN